MCNELVLETQNWRYHTLISVRALAALLHGQHVRTSLASGTASVKGMDTTENANMFNLIKDAHMPVIRGKENEFLTRLES